MAARSLKLLSDPVIELQPTTNLQPSSRLLRQSIAIYLELHQHARRSRFPIYCCGIAAIIGAFILQRYSTLADHPSRPCLRATLFPESRHWHWHSDWVCSWHPLRAIEAVNLHHVCCFYSIPSNTT